MKSSKVCITTKSTLASLLFKDLTTKQTTAKRTIRNNFDCTVEESIVDKNGRFIILRVLNLGGEPALFGQHICSESRLRTLTHFCKLS